MKTKHIVHRQTKITEDLFIENAYIHTIYFF